MSGSSCDCDATSGKESCCRCGPMRVVILLIAGGLIILGALAYRNLRFERPIGAGPAGPAVDAEPFQTPWTDRKVLLLGLGDSVTAGFGVRHDLSYFNRLVENPSDEFGDMKGKCLSTVLPNLTTDNRAVSGSTSIQCLDLIREKLAPQDDDVFGLGDKP